MSVKILEVFITVYDEDMKVGRLAHKDNTIYFEYDKSFLAKNIELSPYKLPLKSGVHICKDALFEGLFGLFADSLPDGWGRLLLDRYFLKQGIKYHDITALDRLSYIGEYGIGALTYRPVVRDLGLLGQDINLDDLSNSSLEILQGNTQEMMETLLAMQGSSSGARPKVMIQLNDQNHIIHGSQKLVKGYEHYMVKFASSSDTKDIGKLEYIYSLMAKDAKVNIPKTSLLEGKQNSYFAIKRFDRIYDKRVHIHSVAGMVHSDFRFPSLDYDDLLTLTLHLTKDKQEVGKMYRLAAFNLFAHNRDDHAKNFSFLLDKNNNWKLSPAYDLTFSYGPGGEHSTTYLGEGKEPRVKHLEKLALKHKIIEYKQTIEEVQHSVSNFREYAKIVGLDNDKANDVFKLLNDNHFKQQ